MVKGLIGRKLNMSQGFDSHGRVVPITDILVRPNYILQIKSIDKDGYKAAQVGGGEAKRSTKPLKGHIDKSKINHTPKVLREVSFDGDISVGQEITVGEVFSKRNIVDVVGFSKGKGFAGVVKRHGFSGGPRTHGQSDRERAPGSIGATTTPGRVYKGTKMAGHMGAERVKVQSLEVIDIDKENNILRLQGSAPGPTGGILIIEKAKKRKKKYHEPDISEAPALSKKDREEKSDQEQENQEGSGKDNAAVDVSIEKKEENQYGKEN